MQNRTLECMYFIDRLLMSPTYSYLALALKTQGPRRPFPICLKLRVLEGFGNYLAAKEGGKEGADEREAGEEFLQANLSCVHGSHSPAKKNNDGICCKERHEVFGVISSPLLCIILGLHSFGLSFKLFGKVLQM